MGACYFFFNLSNSFASSVLIYCPAAESVMIRLQSACFSVFVFFFAILVQSILHLLDNLFHLVPPEGLKGSNHPPRRGFLLPKDEEDVAEAFTG